MTFGIGPHTGWGGEYRYSLLAPLNVIILGSAQLLTWCSAAQPKVASACKVADEKFAYLVTAKWISLYDPKV